MKRKMVVGIAVAVCLCVFALAPVASAQHLLGDTWFQIKVSTKGFGYSTLLGYDGYASFNNSDTVYAHFTPDTTPGMYKVETIFKQGDAWTSWSGTQEIVDLGDGVMVDWEPSFWLSGQPSYPTISAIIRIKRDGSTIKSAKFSSTACYCRTSGAMGWTFYGGCKATGKTVDPLDLPFPTNQ
jgi:hypothetical protein